MECGSASKHEASEGEEVKAGEGLWQALIVPREPPEASRPGEAAFHNPAAGKQNKPALGASFAIALDRLE